MAVDDGTPELGERTVLITGAARRVGRYLAQHLAARGAAVVIHYHRSATEAEALAEQIRREGGRVRLVDGDLTDPEVAGGLVAQAAGAFGPLDVLVNNASVFRPDDALDTTLAAWNHNLAIHATAPFLLGQSFAKQVPEGRDAVIVNMNDWRASRPGPDHFPYTISKAALHALTVSLAQALGPRGIRVNQLALGAVLPPEGGEEGYLHTLRAEIPTHRFPKLAEVAAGLETFLTNRALNGQTLFVDGGRHAV